MTTLRDDKLASAAKPADCFYPESSFGNGGDDSPATLNHPPRRGMQCGSEKLETSGLRFVPATILTAAAIFGSLCLRILGVLFDLEIRLVYWLTQHGHEKCVRQRGTDSRSQAEPECHGTDGVLSGNEVHFEVSGKPSKSTHGTVPVAEASSRRSHSLTPKARSFLSIFLARPGRATGAPKSWVLSCHRPSQWIRMPSRGCCSERAVSAEGSGILDHTTFIQRVNTTGGKGPSIYRGAKN
jgi:hypothetical protein